MENTSSDNNALQAAPREVYAPPAIVHELKMVTRAGDTINSVVPNGVDPLGIDPSLPR